MFRVILFELMTPYHLCMYYNLHASIKLVNLNIREKKKTCFYLPNCKQYPAQQSCNSSKGNLVEGDIGDQRVTS